MVVFPYGAVIAACSSMRRNNEKKPNIPKEKTKPTSKFNISVNADTTNISFDVKNDFDWARAAWALINACKENGQEENLLKILKDEEMEIISGGFDE